MNLRDLQYLVSVADLSSFSRAAEACHVSQPTLSAQIRKLEESLGVTVFERSNRRVMLTPVGERLIASARRILREAETMRELAASARDPLSGPFKLGAFPTLSTYVFPPLVPKVKRDLPQLRLILIEEKTAQLVERLQRGELDAALLALPVAEDGLLSRTLFEDTFFLAVPPDHPLARKRSVTHADLAAQHVLLLEEGHCLRDQALSVCRRMGAEEQDFRATGLETLRQMVKAGTGITLMPQIAIDQRETDIRYLPFAAPRPSRSIGLVWRKTSPRVEVVERLAALLSRP